MQQVPYENRTEAGKALASHMNGYADRDNLIVLALPRGGVPVAFEVAHYLGGTLDLMLVRKLGTPGNEELAMGAIATGGVRVLNQEIIDTFRIDDRDVAAVETRETEELRRREQTYRGDRPTPNLRGASVILVDDGLATGATMRAAVEAVRAQEPAEVIVAVPVAPRETVALLKMEADDVICPWTPENFMGIGRWYAEFGQLEDEDVRTYLQRAWEEEEAKRVSQS